MSEMRKILIVEDSRTQVIHLQNLLEGRNFEVVTAENGKIALSFMANFTPDIILTDIIMPEMDGYEFCKKVKESESWMHIPVILLTSLTDPQDVIKGLNVGADNFIPKPFSSEFLLSRIDHLLINKQMRHDPASDSGVEIFFAGNKHSITSSRMQIIDLLLSTYENAVNKNNELIKANMELVMLKEDLEKKNVLLKSTNEEKNRFIGIAAHDIRNPLGAIFSFTEILKEELADVLTDSQEEIFNYINLSTESLLRLVTDLLDVSKIEAGKLEINYQVNDIVRFIQQNISKNKHLSDKKRITIVEEFDSEEITLPFDPGRMEQVLNNLISNAIKYSMEGTSVTIKLAVEKENIRFSVSDQGVGIPQDEMNKLFKPFSKTSATTTAGESSTGLGLFTCKKIIAAHKGEIGAKSQFGSGSKFYFTLPLDMNSSKENTDKNRSVNDSLNILAGKKILFVDDNEINYSYFKSVFSNYSDDVDWAKKGTDALDCCRNKDYDLIMINIQLPDINGFEVTREIRTFNSSALVICQTAHIIEGMMERCLNAGCNDYVTMPLRPQELIKKVVANFTKLKV